MLRNRQTAAGDDQRVRIHWTPAGFQGEAIAGSVYSARRAIYFDAGAGLPAFVHQHLTISFADRSQNNWPSSFS